jgi:hypothetical protein
MALECALVVAGQVPWNNLAKIQFKLTAES